MPPYVDFKKRNDCNKFNGASPTRENKTAAANFFFFTVAFHIFFFSGDPAVSNQFTHWMWHPCREINSNRDAKVSKFSNQSRPTINHVKDLSRLSFDVPKSN